MSTRNSEYHRRHHLKQAYGITPEDYERLHTEQGGLCALCGRPERAFDSRWGVLKRLAVDHSHRTGRVRSLLCVSCNSSLVAGMDRLVAIFGADLVAKALEYCTPER